MKVMLVAATVMIIASGVTTGAAAQVGATAPALRDSVSKTTQPFRSREWTAASPVAATTDSARDDAHALRCPMPVFVPDSAKRDRMPVSRADSTRAERIPVTNSGCVNRLRNNPPAQRR